MTQDQFKTWLAYHCAVVPAFSAWFTNLAGRVEIKETTSVWYEILKDSDFERCKQVSHDMGTGKIKSDFFFSEHPEFVRDKARLTKQRQTPSEQAAEKIKNRWRPTPEDPTFFPKDCLSKVPEPKGG